MIYSFTLQHVAIALGVAYVFSHGWALWRAADCQRLLRAFPRNYPAGIALMVTAGLWFGWLILNADLMDFAPYQNLFLVATMALTVGMIVFVREFLAVRALGALLLLFANVLLDAAFLDDRWIKLVVTVSAYAYIIAGIALVASPYLLRDALAWIFQTSRRAKFAAAAGVTFGALLLALGILVY
ncbi:MAG: hypothetical protein LBD30_01390 [Verrucomicrobiales bacterium]|jgi:hypothetical protein|nr:hypothetical protein [Verrucomicrobiales bacterium]